MIKIKWKITDYIENFSIHELDTEWNGIFGYFEISINSHILGSCPDRELIVGEEADEDIIYWLTKLLDGIIKLNYYEKYEIQLLSMNLCKIVLERNDDVLVVSLANCDTDIVLWSENVMVDEWYKEIITNIEKFVEEIERRNSALLDSNIIQKLIDIKQNATLNIGFKLSELP